MNFLKGAIGTDQGKSVFLTEGGLRFPVGDVPGNANGRSVMLGVRPEHLVISPAGMPAEVVVVEPTGSETQVNVKNGRQDLICLFRDRILPKPGETIRIAPIVQHIHLFDAATGQRISA